MNKKVLVGIIIAAVLVLLLGLGVMVAQNSKGSYAGSVNQTVATLGAADDSASAKNTESYGFTSDSYAESADNGSTLISENDALKPSSDTMTYDAYGEFSTTQYSSAMLKVGEVASANEAKVRNRSDSIGGGWQYWSTGAYERDDRARKCSMTLRVDNNKVYSLLDGIAAIDGVDVERLRVSAIDIDEDIEYVESAKKDETESLDQLKSDLAKAEQELEAASKALDDYAVNHDGQMPDYNNELQVKYRKAESDVSSLKSRVKSAESVVESYDSTLKQMDKETTYTDVDIVLYERVDAVGEDVLSDALHGSWKAFTNVMSYVLAVIVWLAPYIVLVLIIVGLRILWVRRKRAKISAVPEVDLDEDCFGSLNDE